MSDFNWDPSVLTDSDTSLSTSTTVTATNMTTGAMTGTRIPHEFWFKIYGPMQVGVLVGQFLYGAFAICAFLYLAKCKKDWWINRFVIALLLVTAGLETLFGCTQVIEFTAVHATDLEYLIHMSNKAIVWIRPVVYSVSCLISQVYMTMRILLMAREARKIKSNNGGKSAKGRTLMAIGGLLCVLVIAAWGVTFGAVVDMTLNNGTIDDLMAFTSGVGKLYRILGSCSVALILLVDFIITVVLTATHKFKRVGFFASIADGIVGLTIRNNLIVTLCQVAQVTLTFLLPAWGAVIPLFVGKVYALTVLCIIAQPAYAAQTPTGPKICDLCSYHTKSIAPGVKRCPACGDVLRRETEMTVIPLSPIINEKEKEMSIVSQALGNVTPSHNQSQSQGQGQGQTMTRRVPVPIPSPLASPTSSNSGGSTTGLGIQTLHIKVNSPTEERTFYDDMEGPRGERM